MSKIRFLKFYSTFSFGSSHVHLREGLKFLPNKMSYLEWHGFPLKSLPSTFCAEKLVKLCMPNSHLQKLWNGVQDLVRLQEIDLSGSKQLQELPNLSKCLNLKVVQLSECKSLCYVHSSILSLHSLVELDLFGCKKLRSLKSEVHLRSLQRIGVDLCGNLKEFSVSSDKLTKLTLYCTRIETLHPSVARSSKLKELWICCSRLVDLPNQLSCLTNVTNLSLSGCEVIDDLKLHTLFGGMLSLKIVELVDCGNISELPNNTIHLLGLIFLDVANCRRLRYLPELPPFIESLYADGCPSLEMVSAWRPSGGHKDLSFMNCARLNEQSLHNIMEAAYSIMHEISESKIYVSGSKVPEWFKYRAADSSLIVELPQIPNPVGFCFCIVIGVCAEVNRTWSLTCTCYLEGCEVANSRKAVPPLKMGCDHVFIWKSEYGGIMHGIRKGTNQEVSTNRKLCFGFTVERLGSGNLLIKECGVCPVYASECQKFVQQMQIMGKEKKRPQDVEEHQPLPQFKRFKSDIDEMDPT